MRAAWARFFMGSRIAKEPQNTPTMSQPLSRVRLSGILGISPDGRLMLIVPNRRSMWARLDSTPFGNGRPYSRGQLERLLADAMFTPIDWTHALHKPPFERRFILRSAANFERLGARVTPTFGGVIIVEAKKEVMAPAGTGLKVGRTVELRGGLVTSEGQRLNIDT